jgi:hypothetical protein
MIEIANTVDNHRLLPDPFANLEPLARDWAVSTEQERTARRLASDFSQIKAFHDAMLPQLEAIFEYLNGFALDAMPDDCRRLLYMALAVAEVAPAIHFYKGEPPTYVLDDTRFQRWDIPNMTPKF